MLMQLERLAAIKHWLSNTGPFSGSENSKGPSSLLGRTALLLTVLEFRVTPAATTQVVQASKNKIKGKFFNLFQCLQFTGWSHEEFGDSPAALKLHNLVFHVLGTSTSRIKGAGGRRPGNLYHRRGVNPTAATAPGAVCGLQKNSFKKVLFLFYLISYL